MALARGSNEDLGEPCALLDTLVKIPESSTGVCISLSCSLASTFTLIVLLVTVDLGVWRVTCDGMKPIKNLDKPTKSDEKEIHFNARAKNCLFESFSMDVFNQVFTLNTTHEIWLKLQELHDGTSNVREKKTLSS